MKFRTQRICNFNSMDAPAGVRYVYYTPQPPKPRTDEDRLIAREYQRARYKKKRDEMLAQRQLVIRRRIEDAARRVGVLREAQYLMQQPEYLEWSAKQNGSDMDWAVSDPHILFCLEVPEIFRRPSDTNQYVQYVKITYEALKTKKDYEQIWSNRLYYQRQATPAWCDHAKIEEMVLERMRYDVRHLEQAPWHLDHIIPLKSDVVCGLHVPENLRIITGRENLKKRNRFDESLI